MTPLKLPSFFKHSVLALGSETNTTFSLLNKDTVFLSNPYQDLKDLSVFENFKNDILKERKSAGIKPDVIACDMHPEYISAKYGRDIAGEKKGIHLIEVQHHHAHVVSCMAENGLRGEVIGVAFDGTGYGADGKIWGGEFLIAGYKDFERAAHIAYVPMPGGDKAVLEPIRMAFSYLYKAYKGNVSRVKADILRRLGKEKVGIFTRMAGKCVNSPLTSSAGRLFDAVASLIGVKDSISYEGEAAIALEKIAAAEGEGRYDFRLLANKGIIDIGFESMIKEIISDLRKEPAAVISRKFHNTIAEAVARVSVLLRKKQDLNKVVLSGGVFQNKILLQETKKRLLGARFEVYLHSRVPSNDRGVSLGQAVIAACKCESKHRLTQIKRHR